MSQASLVRRMMIEILASVKIKVMTVLMTNKVVFKDVLYSLLSITSLIFDILYTVQYAIQSNSCIYRSEWKDKYPLLYIVLF